VLWAAVSAQKEDVLAMLLSEGFPSDDVDVWYEAGKIGSVPMLLILLSAVRLKDGDGEIEIDEEEQSHHVIAATQPFDSDSHSQTQTQTHTHTETNSNSDSDFHSDTDTHPHPPTLTMLLNCALLATQDVQTMQFLIQHGATPSLHNNKCLQVAALHGETQFLVSLLRRPDVQNLPGSWFQDIVNDTILNPTASSVLDQLLFNVPPQANRMLHRHVLLIAMDAGNANAFNSLVFDGRVFETMSSRAIQLTLKAVVARGVDDYVRALLSSHHVLPEHIPAAAEQAIDMDNASMLAVLAEKYEAVVFTDHCIQLSIMRRKPQCFHMLMTTQSVLSETITPLYFSDVVAACLLEDNSDILGVCVRILSDDPSADEKLLMFAVQAAAPRSVHAVASYMGARILDMDWTQFLALDGGPGQANDVYEALLDAGPYFLAAVTARALRLRVRDTVAEMEPLLMRPSFDVDVQGGLVLCAAVEANNEDVARLLLDGIHGRKPAYVEQPIRIALEAGNVSMLHMLVRRQQLPAETFLTDTMRATLEMTTNSPLDDHLVGSQVILLMAAYIDSVPTLTFFMEQAHFLHRVRHRNPHFIDGVILCAVGAGNLRSVQVLLQRPDLFDPFCQNYDALVGIASMPDGPTPGQLATLDFLLRLYMDTHGNVMDLTMLDRAQGLGGVATLHPDVQELWTPYMRFRLMRSLWIGAVARGGLAAKAASADSTRPTQRTRRE
jgi:hypothetical protein